MHGSEMAVDFRQLFFEDDAEQFDFEATFVLRGLRHLFRVLTSSGDHVELLVFFVVKKRTDGDSSSRLVSIVEGSDLLESLRVEQLDIAVS